MNNDRLVEQVIRILIGIFWVVNNPKRTPKPYVKYIYIYTYF